MAEIAAIVLAAGRASRFRQADPETATKLVASYKGKPLVRHVAQAALAAGLAPVVVVTGCEADRVTSVLDGLDVRFAHNARFDSGMASSIVTGVSVLPQTSDAVFILLGDMPLVGADLLRKLIGGLAENPDAAAIVPVYDGVRGNPVLLSRGLFGRAMRLQGDEGARRMLREPGLKVVEVASDKSASFDVDTPDVLRELDG